MSAKVVASGVEERYSRFLDGIHEGLHLCGSLMLQADAFARMNELCSAIVVR